ncbi:MAG: cytidylate kinase-like family protein [Myxococcales bacterium]|nr:cytidylate kinase-like family protein [Myxococcales bacterium]
MTNIVLDIVERQVKSWQKQRNSAKTTRALPAHFAQNITISRQFGAGGLALAQALGQRLGFSVWDNELVQAIAVETGASEKILRALDEHHRGGIEDAVQGMLLGSTYTRSAYLERMMKLITTIAAHGNNVIVGRGSQYVVAEALHVRVVCPLDIRVTRYAEKTSLSTREALEEIKRNDADRQAFLRQHYNQDNSNPEHYGLVVNTGVFSIEELTDLIASVYTAKYADKAPQPLQR